MSVNDEIKVYLNRKIGQYWDKWDRYVVDPYATAYVDAFNGFKTTLDNQAKYDKMITELAVTALTLCGGSIYTAVLGNITIKSKAASFLLDEICKRNMEKAFTVYAFVDGNKTAQFIVGKAWDMMQSSLSDRLKSLYVENTNNYSSTGKMLDDPLKVYLNLKGFFDDCKIKLTDTLEELLAVNMGETQKGAIFSEIKKGAFCSPPQQNIYSKKGDLAKNLELSFYLKMIMDSDFEVKSLNDQCPSCHTTPTSRTPINVSTSSPKYPYFTQNSHAEYETIGTKILEAANDLYKKFEKTNTPLLEPGVFGSKTNFYVLGRAEQTLKKLGNHYQVERFIPI